MENNLKKNTLPEVVTKAVVRNLKSTPRKVSLVTDLIRGKSIAHATQQLMFCKKRVAFNILKLLNSAKMNSENNHKYNSEDLYISQILVGKSMTLKRIMPAAKGSAHRILKRYSQVTICLSRK